MTWRNDRTKLSLGAVAACVYGFMCGMPAVNAASEFYLGKTVYVLAGVSGGGDVDFKMRLVARYIGKYLPGHPTVVPENMVGATGLTMANYLYNVAPKDGTYIGLIQNGLPTYQLSGMAGAQFETSKFNWIGSISPSNETMAVWKTARVKTIEQAETKELPTGAVGTTGSSTSFPRLLNELLGTKFELIRGYSGAGDVNLAMERGEVAARAGPWSSWKTNNSDWLRNGDLKILVYTGPRNRDLAAVPYLADLVKTDEDRALVAFVTAGDQFGQPFATSPGTPKAQVEMLRRAFAKTMADPDFLKDLANARSDADPISGQDLQRISEGLATASENVQELGQSLA